VESGGVTFRGLTLKHLTIDNMKWIFIVSWCAVVYANVPTGYCRLECNHKKYFINKDSAMIFYITQLGNSISTPVFNATTFDVKLDSIMKSPIKKK
jgi:hypothetical protein